MANDKPVAPKTKEYLLKKLNALEKSTNEARYHEERLSKEIQELEAKRRIYSGNLAQELEERNHLLKLFEEVGGHEYEITG